VVQLAPNPVIGAGLTAVEPVVADVVGLNGSSEDTELEVEAVRGRRTAGPCDDPVQAEPTKTVNPIAAERVRRLIAVFRNESYVPCAGGPSSCSERRYPSTFARNSASCSSSVPALHSS
jgi:hypothetical protein